MARYAWTFGDGASATTSSPTTTHTYAKAGTYTATLTVTDNEGCSTQQVFTGQTMSCNGSSAATTQHTVTVPGQTAGCQGWWCRDRGVRHRRRGPRHPSSDRGRRGAPRPIR